MANLVFTPNGNYVLESTIAVLIAAADAANKPAVVTGAATVSADTTVPATISLEVVKGGVITVNSGKTLTINGPFKGTPGCFAGTGAVVFGSGSVSAVNPDWFTGTDTEKVQWGVTTALASGAVPMQVERLYTLTAAVNIDRTVDTTTNEFRIIGLGKDAGFYTSATINMFSSTLAITTSPRSEFITFEGIRFESSANTVANFAVDGDAFLRMKFLNCYFRKIRCAFTNNYFQSWRFQNCNIRRMKGIFMEATIAGPSLTDGVIYDTHFTDCVFEEGDSGQSALVKAAGAFIGSSLKGNVFENATGPFFQSVGSSQGVAITGNYFEVVTGSVIKLGTTQAISITGNLFNTSADPGYYNIDCETAVNVYGAGNYAAGNLYKRASMTSGFDGLTSVGDYSLSGYIYGDDQADNHGSFTLPLTGMTAATNIDVKYTISHNQVTLFWATTTATSNTNAMTIANPPAILLPRATTRQMLVRTVDNGAYSVGVMEITTSTINIYKTIDGGSTAFTNSGTKGLLQGSVTYSLYP